MRTSFIHICTIPGCIQVLLRWIAFFKTVIAPITLFLMVLYVFTTYCNRMLTHFNQNKTKLFVLQNDMILTLHFYFRTRILLTCAIWDSITLIAYSFAVNLLLTKYITRLVCGVSWGIKMQYFFLSIIFVLTKSCFKKSQHLKFCSVQIQTSVKFTV